MPGPEDFRFTDPRQARIHQRLHLISPGAAAFYREACSLMSSRAMASTTHLVAHLLREIESSLRAVVLPSGFTPQNPEERHKEEIQTILTAYEFDDTDEVRAIWLKLAGRGSGSLSGFAHRDALGPPRPIDERFLRLWDEVQSLLDVILRKFERRFLDSFPILDALAQKATPGAADITTLRNKVPNNLVTLVYFFDRLENPAWLPLLRNEGFFTQPPKPERDEEAGTITFQLWPLSRFLARMASIGAVQATVLEIALEIPDTENVSVQQDLVDVAIALPTELSVRLADRLTTWAGSPYHLMPEKFGELASCLAKCSELEAALRLAKSLFAVFPEEREAPAAPEDEELRLPPRPRGHFDTWRYRRVLEKLLPAVVEAAGMRALELVSDLLEEGLRIASREGDAGKPEDYSGIWRAVIERGGEHEGYGVKDVLVSAVRDAAELLVRANPANLMPVVEHLEGRGWHVFRRIALTLLRTHPEGAEGLIRERLTSKELFDASHGPDFRREYRLLARGQFGHLSPKEKGTILGWIEEGPDVEAFRPRAEAWEGKPPTEEQVARYVDGWRLEHLAPIAASLPPDWRGRYDELVRKHGAPTETDLGFEPHGIFVGPTSEKSADELREMTAEEIVDFLRTWVPPTGFMAPSAEGLGRSLAAAVAAQPERFAAACQRFQGLDPTYVRALLSGLHKALGEKRPFPWPSVLELCKWVVDQPREIPGRRVGSHYEDGDPDWGWTRQQICSLLASGFGEGETGIPFELRDGAWRVLQPLTHDPEPTEEDEARRQDSTPLEIAINTTRGEAIHAAVKYGIWVRRQVIQEANGKEQAFHGLTDIPELREVLDAHLDLEEDLARSVRAVYGRWLPWLVHMDREWVMANRGRLFPGDPALAGYRDAAWDTFVTSWAAIIETFEALREEYAAAVERIGRPTPKHGPNPEESLAAHLMTLYWVGRLPLAGAGSELLSRFFEKADDSLRAEAIEYVGRSLKNTEGDVAPEILERFTALWNLRYARAREAAPNRELSAFGWWFTSKKLDPQWAMTQLLEVLKIGRKIDPDFSVVEQLANLAPAFPLEVTECLLLLVEGADQPWTILSWGEYLERAIPAALAAPDAAARGKARDLVNLLGARGHLDFRRFLAPGG